MESLQSIYGVPKLEDRLFLVSISFQDDDSNWTEIVPAETAEEAVSRVQEFYRTKKEWARKAIINSPKLFKSRFNGRVFEYEADQYVSHCKGGGINLHIYKIGGYKECYSCGKVEEPLKNQSKLCDYTEVHNLEHNQWQLCSNSAHCASEQAEP